MDLTAPEAPPRESPDDQCTMIAPHLARIGDRWTLPVVVTLRDGPLRFNQLRRTVTGISQQMLTRKLRALERDGMVIRTVHPSVPPQVEYTLTALGLGLADEGARLGHWVRTHITSIEESRRAFDSRHP